MPVSANTGATAPTGNAQPHKGSRKPAGPVLLAVSGDSNSRASAAMAAAIADQLGTSLLVVTVVEPVPLYASAPGMVPLSPVLEETRWAAQKDAVHTYMTNAIGAHPWKLHMRTGSIAREVCAVAQEFGAVLIVAGSGPRRRGDRITAGARAAQILRRAPCPVLSVAPQATGLPRQIVSATDFGSPSLYAAETGLRICSPHAKVTLVNVAFPVPLPKMHQDNTGALIGGDAGTLFSHVRELLEPFRPASVTIDTRQESGFVTDALLAAADATEADLITIGTHGPGIIERIVLGSVAADVLHLAVASVLAAPAPPADEAARFALGLLGTVVNDTPETWGEVLDAFSERNAGRTVTLEVDDLSMGAQLQASNYVLQGIVYDPRDRRVECMLSTTAATSGAVHLTRMIDHVQAVAIHARDGRDEALEIRQEQGHTILMLGDSA